MARLIRGLASCPRVLKLYPPGHQRAEAYLGDFERLFHDLLKGRREPFRITVAGVHVEVDGLVPDLPPEVGAGFAIMLRRRRIRVLAVHHGIVRDEIQQLVELLACDHKELLKLGGPRAFLDRRPHPHVDVLTSGDGYGTGGGGGRGSGGPAEEGEAGSIAHELLEDLLTSPDTLERMNALRARYERLFRGPRRSDALGATTFNQLLREYFERPEWSELGAAEVRRALETFLELLEEALAQGAPSSDDPREERLATLTAYFGGLAPTEVTKRFDMLRTPIEDNKLEFGLARIRELREGLEGDGVDLSENLRQEIRQDRPERTTLAVLERLLADSKNKEQYEKRREILVATLQSGRFTSAETAGMLADIALHLPPLPWEGREELVNAALQAIPGDDALVAFTLSLSATPELVYPILERLAERPDPFSLLVRLLGMQALSTFHTAVANRLCEAARAKQGAFHAWAKSHRDELFEERVFEALFRRGTELMGTISKDIITHGPARDRKRLLERLCDEGGPAALRLLVLGLPFGDETCSHDLMASLARFDHPLAAGALREIVLRSNVGPVRETEAGAALRALMRQNLEDGTDFLMRVAGERSWGLPRFRRPLRSLARQVLVEENAR